MCTKKKSAVRSGGQGGCIQRIEVIVKMRKSRGQGGCVRRIEVFVKMQKSRGRGGGGSQVGGGGGSGRGVRG